MSSMRNMMLSIAACLLATGAHGAATPAGIAPDIAFEKFQLDNGLTVVVHTDRKAPIVAVNIWYHVGGKDEPSNRNEFAHLFEHLMFQGSENYRGEFFKPFEEPDDAYSVIGLTSDGGSEFVSPEQQKQGSRIGSGRPAGLY